MAQMPFYEVNQAITAMGGEDLNLCMQCGLCAGLCPWREVDGEFYPHQMIRMGQLAWRATKVTTSFTAAPHATSA